MPYGKAAVHHLAAWVTAFFFLLLLPPLLVLVAVKVLLLKTHFLHCYLRHNLYRDTIPGEIQSIFPGRRCVAVNRKKYYKEEEKWEILMLEWNAQQTPIPFFHANWSIIKKKYAALTSIEGGENKQDEPLTFLHISEKNKSCVFAEKQYLVVYNKGEMQKTKKFSIQQWLLSFLQWFDVYTLR